MDNSPPSSTGTYLVIIVGILAAVALVLGVMSLKRTAALADKIGEVAVADIAARVETMDKKTSDAAKAATDAKTNVANLAVTTQRAFDDVGSELSTMRTTLNKITSDTQTVVDRIADSELRGSSRPSSSSGSDASAPAAGTTTTAGTYVVKSGDTLSKIGAQFGVSWQRIAAANPSINPNDLKIGQELYIPQGN